MSFEYGIVLLILISTGFHELGHYLTARVYGYKAHFTIHNMDPAIKIDKMKMGGRGFVPIVVSGSVFHALSFYPFLALATSDPVVRLIFGVAVPLTWSKDYFDLAKVYLRKEKAISLPNWF